MHDFASAGVGAGLAPNEAPVWGLYVQPGPGASFTGYLSFTDGSRRAVIESATREAVESYLRTFAKWLWWLNEGDHACTPAHTFAQA
jgi:hypothetical protein